MARSELALRRARHAYERAHVASAARGVALGLLLTIFAVALHRATDLTWLVAAALAATLATLGWRGGGWRRGALAGLLAGIPVFVAPAIYFLMMRSHCASCAAGPPLTCVLVCIGTSLGAGTLVGHLAARDHSSRRFALGAVATALLTGLLGCGTVGVAGAIGVVLGVATGGVTGWVVSGRTARA